MNTRKLALIGLFLAFGTTISTAETFEKVFEHDFLAEKFEKTELEITRGDISMSGTDGPHIKVVIKMNFEARSQAKADAVFDAYKIRFTEENGVAKAVLQEEKSGWSWMFFWRDEPEIEVGVQLPKGVNLKLASGEGDLQMADLEATLNIASGSGDVQGRNLKGTLNMAAGAGDVVLTAFDGRLQAATGAGDLNASGSFSSFEIANGKGDVDLVSSNPIQESSAIASGMGDITLTLPGNSAFDLASEIGWGDIVCDFEVDATTREKKELRGTVNGGGPKLSVAAGFGDLAIRAGKISE